MPRIVKKPVQAASNAAGRKSDASDANELLAAGVAHDVNNLLTIIAGQRELIRRGGGRRRAKDREVLRKAAEQAQRLISRLLAFGRKPVMQAKALNLNAQIEKMRQMLDRLTGENVEVELRLDPKLGRVQADAARLGQIVLNLAINAREAMPLGGRLTLETSSATLDGNSKWGLGKVARGRYVILSVRDTGSGMDRETLRQVFEPFFTTKRRGKGLGLAIVSEIVRQCNGHIRANSTPGQGTTFKIYFPVIEKGVRRVRPVPTAVTIRRGSKTVLLVEDDPAVRNVARQFLEIGGYRVLEAKSGTEAIRIAKNCAVTIHLLVTDVAMPSMNGPELARRLIQLRPRLKVLYVSGFSGASLRRQSLPEGAHLLQKPYDLESMTRKLKEVLDFPRQPRRTGGNSPKTRRGKT